MQQTQAMPSMLGIGRPSCPRCGSRMMLARISPLQSDPRYDKRFSENLSNRGFDSYRQSKTRGFRGLALRDAEQREASR